MRGELTTLKNVGNTCYINSLIQVLRHTEIMNDMLNSMTTNQLSNEKANILREWDSLRRTMWKQRCVVSPYRFLHYVREGEKTKELTNNFEQQDVGEFLIVLLEEFHEGIKRPVKMNVSGRVRSEVDVQMKEMYKEYKKIFQNNYSEIIDIFYGMQQTKICRINTKETLCIKVEPLSILNLAILDDNAKTLNDCMDEYCKTEVLCGDNRWLNEKTGLKEEVTITTSFVYAPKILIISLKKYANEKQMIIFPLENFNLQKYMMDGREILYECYGVCNHSGGMNYGHYFSYVKVNGKWYSFNDVQVKEIQERHVITKSAYCLFYRKI